MQPVRGWQPVKPFFRRLFFAIENSFSQCVCVCFRCVFLLFRVHRRINLQSESCPWIQRPRVWWGFSLVWALCVCLGRPSTRVAYTWVCVAVCAERVILLPSKCPFGRIFSQGSNGQQRVFACVFEDRKSGPNHDRSPSFCQHNAPFKFLWRKQQLCKLLQIALKASPLAACKCRGKVQRFICKCRHVWLAFWPWCIVARCFRTFIVLPRA